MLKPELSGQDLERQARQALADLFLYELDGSVSSERFHEPDDRRRADFIAHVRVADRQYNLVCEVKRSGQPREVRLAVWKLREYVDQHRGSVPVFIAPYLSEESRRICRENGVGFLDLEGNVRLAFGSVLVDRVVPTKPKAERRELKFLFGEKSSQVLRVMLRDPRKDWRVAGLSEAAHVSLGHTSNVRAALFERTWAESGYHGFHLAKPDELLDAWRAAYAPPRGELLSFYTLLHGSKLQDAVRDVMAVLPAGNRLVFSSFSAAQWLAPYARYSVTSFYADRDGLQRLRDGLRLESAAKGENVRVLVPAKGGVFLDVVEPAPAVRCTSAVQTYLDLTRAGDRGIEAAEHLRREKLKWL
jgi:hypothetical protein